MSSRVVWVWGVRARACAKARMRGPAASAASRRRCAPWPRRRCLACECYPLGRLRCSCCTGSRLCCRRWRSFTWSLRRPREDEITCQCCFISPAKAKKLEAARGALAWPSWRRDQCGYRVVDRRPSPTQNNSANLLSGDRRGRMFPLIVPCCLSVREPFVHQN